MTGAMPQGETGFEPYDTDPSLLDADGFEELEGADGEDRPEQGVDPIVKLTALYADRAADQDPKQESLDEVVKRVDAVMRFIKVINPSTDFNAIESRVGELVLMDGPERALAFDRLDHLTHWLFTGERTMPREFEGNASYYMTNVGEVIQALITEDMETGDYYQGGGFSRAFDKIFAGQPEDEAAAHGAGEF